MNARQQSRPFYIQGERGAFFAFVHHPPATVAPTAVLLCPPFGWEDMCSYRIRREWAEELAQSGYTTLRIDLPGSGDSAGSPSDPEQLEGWRQAIDDAAGWLREDPAHERVAAVGIGLGGLAATLAALRGAPIDELALWAVPARGHTLLRQLRSFSVFDVAQKPGSEDSDPSPDDGEDGSLMTNGYLLSAETVADLERLDLREIEPERATLERALLLGRDGMKVDKALTAVLEGAGAEVTIADGPGFGSLMVEPQDARRPAQVFARVGAWLAQARDSARSPSDDHPRAAAGDTAPRDSEEMIFQAAGATLRERPVSLAGPDGPLFGIVTEPTAARRELSAVLVNAGPQRRTGPNRMWVEIARRWAAAGVPTLRLDAAGIGDSAGDSKVLARIAEFYRPHYVEQVQASLEQLAAEGLPPRFVALGLCAGAYWSSHTALADERVAAVVMLNPRTLIYDKRAHTARRTRELRKRALMASTWRKAFSGELRLARHLETGRSLAAVAATLPARTRERLLAARARDRSGDRRRTARDPIEGMFDSLRERDQRALLLFTGNEVLRRELTGKGVFDQLERWPNIEVEFRGTSADTHTLTPRWLQQQVHALVDRALEAELDRLPKQPQ